MHGHTCTIYATYTHMLIEHMRHSHMNNMQMCTHSICEHIHVQVQAMYAEHTDVADTYVCTHNIHNVTWTYGHTITENIQPPNIQFQLKQGSYST